MGPIDILVGQGGLVVAVPQCQRHAFALQLKTSGAGALAQAEQGSPLRHTGGDLDVLVLLSQHIASAHIKVSEASFNSKGQPSPNRQPHTGGDYW